MKKFLLLQLILFFVTGCFSKPDPKLFIGKYRSNQIDYNDSIFVNENKTYKHKYTTPKGKEFELEGTWEYDSVRMKIIFRDFVFFNNEGTDGLPPGNWISKVQIAEKGEVRLIYAEENNIYYYKKE